jgi:hypothetical protein
MFMQDLLGRLPEDAKKKATLEILLRKQDEA